MDDFRVALSAVLLQFGYESSQENPSDDELICMVRELGERMEELERKVSGD